MQGCVHIYCGDGKGKSTAAAGLTLRAAGAGNRAAFVQFFKDGSSSEIALLRQLPGVEVLVCQRKFGFYKKMNEQERLEAREAYTALLESAIRRTGDGLELLVLDEAVSACNHGIISEARVLEFLADRPETLEVVLTGRNPSEALLSAADYVTEMKKLRHPFDRGIAARRGIEY